jgi:hypothetical protein
LLALKPGDEVQHGRLAAPARTDDADELPVRDLERDVVDRQHRGAVPARECVVEVPALTATCVALRAFA